MITYDGMIESMQIFRKYAGSGEEEFPMEPMHDQLYAGPNPEIVNEEDKMRLSELGWFEEDESFCLFT